MNAKRSLLMKGNQHRARSLDDAFKVQLARVRRKLSSRGANYRKRLTTLGEGQPAVEVRGTSGGGPSRYADERDATSERDLYGAW